MSNFICSGSAFPTRLQANRVTVNQQAFLDLDAANSDAGTAETP